MDPEDDAFLKSLQRPWTEEEQAKLDEEARTAGRVIGEIMAVLSTAMPRQLGDDFETSLDCFVMTYPTMARRLAKLTHGRAPAGQVDDDDKS